MEEYNNNTIILNDIERAIADQNVFFEKTLNDLEEINSTIDILISEKENLQKDINDYTENMLKTEDKLQKNLSDLTEIKHKMVDSEKNINKLSNAVSGNPEATQYLNELKDSYDKIIVTNDDLGKAIQEDATQIDLLKNKLNDLTVRLNDILQSIHMTDDKKGKIKNVIQEIKNKLSVSDNINTNSTLSNNASESANKLLEKARDMTEKISKIGGKHDEIVKDGQHGANDI